MPDGTYQYSDTQIPYEFGKSADLSGQVSDIKNSYQQSGEADSEQNYRSFLPTEISSLLKDKNNLTLSAKIQKSAVLNSPVDNLAIKYYRIALSDLSSIDNIDNDNLKIKLKDIGNEQIEKFIESKYKVNKQIDVVIPKINSSICNAVKSSIELKYLIKVSYSSIRENNYLNKSIGLNFTKSSDLSLIIGKSELYNPQIDEQGNFTAFLIDKYDFSEMNYKLNNSIKQAAISFINNNAYEQQLKGALKNYVIIIPVNIDKDTLQGILNEK